MVKEQIEHSYLASELNWKKDDNYIDRYSEVMNIMHSDRSVIIDFGSLEDEGREVKKGIGFPKNPFISHHTRIRVSPQHYIAIVNVFKTHLEKNKEILGVKK